MAEPRAVHVDCEGRVTCAEIDCGWDARSWVGASRHMSVEDLAAEFDNHDCAVEANR